jgi:hypothetical protein
MEFEAGAVMVGSHLAAVHALQEVHHNFIFTSTVFLSRLTPRTCFLTN